MKAATETSPTKKVVARYLLAKSFGDPRLLLQRFEGLLRKHEVPQKDIDSARRTLNANLGISYMDLTKKRGESPELQEAVQTAISASVVIKYKSPEISEVGDLLALALLQETRIETAVLRRKIEIAARFFTKPFRPRGKAKDGAQIYLEYLEHYERYFAECSSLKESAVKALDSAPTEVEDSRDVGGFRVVNTGGFLGSTIDTICDLVQKASALTKSSGLGKVCYGNVLVTNTLIKGSVLAFYRIAEDELLIRANVKGEILRTVLHELGHRYRYQFMRGGEKAIQTLYNQMQRGEDSRQDTLATPKVGDQATVKGLTWEVEKLEYSRGALQVRLFNVNDPKVKGTMPLQGWQAISGVDVRNPDDPNLKGFITEYAKRGGPEENFAELFSFYCLGKMPKEYREAFESVVF